MLQTNKRAKIFYGIIVGITTYAVIGLLGLFLLKLFWKEYSVASKDKSYTLVMMLLRLAVGMIASIFSGIVTTVTAKDKGRTSWIVGVIVFFIVGYNHFL